MSAENPLAENPLIAAYLIKPIRNKISRVRKEPLVFTKRTRRPDFFASLPPEPEDARITGTTRSLYRRLLALNLHATRISVSSVLPLTQQDAKIA